MVNFCLSRLVIFMLRLLPVVVAHGQLLSFSVIFMLWLLVFVVAHGKLLSFSVCYFYVVVTCFCCCSFPSFFHRISLWSFSVWYFLLLWLLLVFVVPHFLLLLHRICFLFQWNAVRKTALIFLEPQKPHKFDIHTSFLTLFCLLCFKKNKYDKHRLTTFTYWQVVLFNIFHLYSCSSIVAAK